MHYLQALLFAGSLAEGAAAMALYPRQQSVLAAMLGNSSWSSGTAISYPNSTSFVDSTLRWDIYAPPSYQAVISPSTEGDVVQAVNLARQHDISFLATGGRHGYSTTLGEMQDGLAIDLTMLNTVIIDEDAAQLTIGPGVRFRDIFGPVYEAGFEIQTGTCSCVGMMGATLGGGIGRLHGIHGLILDALLSVRMVTADGQIVEASATTNPDLFWGIRGAGQNFGIVISATYELHPLTKGGVWTSADILFTPEKNVSYFETVEKMQPLPAELTVETIMNYNGTLESPQLMLSLAYAGPKDEAIRAMKPILDLNPAYSLIKEISWRDLSTQTTFLLDGPVCADGQIYDVYAVNLRNFSVPTMVTSFEKMAQFWEEEPAGRNSVIVLETWPVQAATAIPNDATAYPWRDATTYVMIQMRWDNVGDPVQGTADVLGPEIRSDMAATSGYDDLTVYVNYAWGDETLEQIYGKEKLPRLAQLKAQYDPHNAFGFYHALPTSYP
ncbi:putative FAD-binding PCMH-type domain-containing protein [Seiridium cardinale]|uniref:FAD-binding PCMH-type domain-containing protein n=1 Tax=Seiridium cardinale TaxID=138064 RepID=A0ABR2XTU2_9PEZI